MAEWAARTWRAMGSSAELLVHADRAERLVCRAVTEVERLERTWSRFRSTSDLSHLNAAEGDGPFRIADELAQAIRVAIDMYELTAGRFDPTVLAALEALGYDRRFELVAAKVERVARRLGQPSAGCDDRSESVPAPGLGDVSFDDHGLLRRPEGVRLDLGGIGKGLAVDRVVSDLARNGATSVCLSLGGDLAVRGPGPCQDGSWLIPVRTPLDDHPRFEFPMANDAIVQSTTLLRRWRKGSGEVNHLIDPATGRSADTGIVSAIVTGPSAAVAEAVAKAALIAGPTEGPELIVRAGYDGWLVAADGSMTATEHVRDSAASVAS